MPKTRPLKLEREILEDLDAKPHANSGAMKKKHDGSTQLHLFEVKTTTKDSFSISRTYWEGLEKQAMMRRLEPIMVVAFDDGYGVARGLDKVVVMDYEHFRQLVSVGGRSLKGVDL